MILVSTGVCFLFAWEEKFMNGTDRCERKKSLKLLCALRLVNILESSGKIPRIQTA